MPAKAPMDYLVTLPMTRNPHPRHCEEGEDRRGNPEPAPAA